MFLAFLLETSAMPEGPSIGILKEETLHFKGKKVLEVRGNAKIDLQRMQGKKLEDIKTWGKHFLLCFDGFYLRIHLLLFGTYRIDEAKETPPRLHLRFSNGELNFYACSVRLVEGRPEDTYDWKVDTLSDAWDPAKALRAVKKNAEEMVCDILLDQDIFAGSGNIVKNEVLFRIKVHPETLVGALPLKKKKELVAETRIYVGDFYRWKKNYELKKHWQAHRKTHCPDCRSKLKLKVTGKRKRRSFFCGHCQILYA